MQHEQIDELLKRTLSDFRLSRGEKRIVADLADEAEKAGLDLDFLRHRAFALVQDELRDPQSKQVVDWLEDVIKVLRPRPAEEPPRPRVYFSPGDECLNAIRGLLERAKKTVDICVFTITDDRIADEILETAGRGVAVRIITDDDKSLDAGSDISRLKSRGVPIRCDRSEYHMHHKFAVIDRETVLTGSYNWTRGAARNNEENLVVHQDLGLASEFIVEFERLWKEFR